jgi:hypothetical protein
MSEYVNCEICGQTGSRRRNAKTPLGWLGAEIFINPPTDPRMAMSVDDPQFVFCLSVCSHTCAAEFWQAGGTQSLDGKNPAVVCPEDILEAPVSGGAG